MDMAGPAIRIGDQLILEEDYDETYIPSEHEIQEFAREIGIDPETEPGLMWLAREGIVAPLPPEWKPCQDITGDIYYFNFANGQSTWDHPCDEHYRELVVQEREKLSAHGGVRKKDKKKKKEKKEKKEKREREPVNHAAEMQPEPGILPSTSFYRMSSPILSSECASPDLDQESQIRNEGFLKKGKGRTSARPPETHESNRQLSGAPPNKLQPLLTAKSSRTHRILADVEKILGRTSSFSKLDVDNQQGQDKAPRIGDKPGLGCSDSESEGLDVKPKLLSCVSKKSCLQDTENVSNVPGCPEAREGKGLLFVEEKLASHQKEETAGGGVCLPDDSLPVRERSTGPGGDKEKGPGLSQADDNEAALTPCAPDHIFYSRKCAMILFEASPTEDLSLMGELDAHCPQQELRAHSRAAESRRKVLSQATKLCKSSEAVGKCEQEGSKQAELVQSEGAGQRTGSDMAADPLPYTTRAGADTPTSEPVCLSAGQHKDQGKADCLGPEPESSITSSSADHFASQVLGEVDNFSWDLQSSHGSDKQTDLLTAAKGPLSALPLTAALQAQPQSSANEKLLSEYNSEDERRSQHVRENDQVPSQEHSCVSFNMKLNRSRDAPEKNIEGRPEETGGGEGRTEPVPRGLEADLFPEVLQVPPGWLAQPAECQESSRPCRQEGGELTQSRKATEENSKLVLWEGAGSNEAPGSLLAPVQAPPGSLAPLRGAMDGPGSALRGSPSTSVENSGVSSLLLREATLAPQTIKPSGLTRSLLGSMHDGKASFNLLALEEGEEEEESEDQTPRGTARLLRNLHMDISALGDGFEYEKESLQESRPEDRHECPLDSDGVCPPAPAKPAYSSLCGPDKEEPRGEPLGSELLEKEETDVEDAVSVAYEQSGSPGARAAVGTEVVSSLGPPTAASAGVRAAEADRMERVAVTADTRPASDKSVNGARAEAAGRRSDRKLDASEESDASEHVRELQVSDQSDHELLHVMDFGFPSWLSEQVLDVGVLSAALDSAQVEAQGLGEEEKDQSQASLEAEQSKRTEGAESEREQSPASACEGAEEKCLSLESAGQEERAAVEQKEGSLNSRTGPEESAAPHQVALREEIKQAASLNRPCAQSPEEIAQELEQDKMRFLQAKEEKLKRFQEELRQEEEEEARMLHQQKEKSLQSLKEELTKASEEEELRMREEEAEKLSKLRAQISSEADTEKEKIRAEQAAALHRQREEWESLQKVEQESLEERKKQALACLKLEVEEAQQREVAELEQEKERVLEALKERLERERREAAEALEKQFATELQELKSAAEEKHQKVVSNLRKQIAEAQRCEEAQLQEELERAELKVQHKMSRVADFERELSELMKETRQDVERDHERKMERMKEEHREALARIQDQYEEEERKQRAEKLEELRGELERLRQLHDGQLRALRKELDEQLSDLQQGHKAKRLQELEMELEIRAKEAKARSAQLNHQEEAMRKRRQQALEDEKQLELERNEAALAAQLRLEESRKEHAALVESIRQLRRALEELQDQKAELESQVDLLQTRSQRLQKRISELEAAVQSKQEALKELAAEDSVASPRREAELHVEDLRETPEARASREPASLPSHSNGDSDLRLDNVRHYISAEGVSIRSAKEFLVQQTRSLRKRHAVLKAAKLQWRHDMQQAQDEGQDLDSSQLLDDVRQSLEEESKQLGRMKSAMRKGQVLLKKKEEKLSQLESSLLEELSDEDTLRGLACKKAVTFDLSDSDATSSLSSTEVPPHAVDVKPDAQFPQLDKIQHLTDTLQHITTELNGVLGALGSLSRERSPLFAPGPAPALPSDGLPLSAYTSVARVPPAGVPLVNQWAWSSGVSSSLAAAGQSVDSLLAEKWRKYFPAPSPANPEPANGGSPALAALPGENVLRAEAFCFTSPLCGRRGWASRGPAGLGSAVCEHQAGSYPPAEELGPDSAKRCSTCQGLTDSRGLKCETCVNAARGPVTSVAVGPSDLPLPRFAGGVASLACPCVWGSWHWQTLCSCAI
ncbi:centrosomal protein of 164 kDa isoform X3 [Pelodiscus sinensis]|uniref:centrosomal protein of 164 kDa isoform X3 n=1 Tax=Pelodiscus sinensis TaxID=13735 RepID=UPI003F6CE87D